MNRPMNWLLAALYGAVGAIVIAYGGSYLITHLGASVVNSTSDRMVSGPAVLRLAALNLYAIQHITLAGSGKVIDPLGAGFVTAHITLPITVWFIIPAIGLMIGGYAAAKLRAGTSRRDMTFPAVAGGVIYALILVAMSGLAQAQVGSFLLPEIEGIGANPPPIIFRPLIGSTLIYATGFGLLFLYLGSLLAVREEMRSRAPARWWACAKAVIVVSLVFQLLIAVVGMGMMRRHQGAQPITMSAVAVMPTAAGIAYGMLYGSTLHAVVSARMEASSEPQQVLDYHANLYQGTVSATDGNEKRKSMPLAVVLAGFLVAACAAFVSGWLSVRWGSTDGSIPTGFRLMIAQIGYLVVLTFVCKLVLFISNKSEAFHTTSITAAGLGFSWVVVPALVVYFTLGLLGAYTAHRRFSASPAGFPLTW